MWPDLLCWHILGTNFLTQIAQIFRKLFGPLWKMALFKSNSCALLFGNFWINLGYLLFQHLVTLNATLTLITQATNLSLSSAFLRENVDTALRGQFPLQKARVFWCKVQFFTNVLKQITKLHFCWMGKTEEY